MAPKSSQWHWEDDTAMQGYVDWVARKTINELKLHGFITDKQHELIDAQYGMVMVKKGMFSKAIDKLLHLNDENSYNLRLVKLDIDKPTAPPRTNLTVLHQDRMDKLDTEE